MPKPRNVHFVRTPAQLAALTNPSRLAILDRLTALGPLPARDLAKALNRKVTAVYRHLNELHACGLVTMSQTKAIGARGRPRVMFGPIAKVIRVVPQDSAARRTHLARIAKSIAVHAARDFTRALDGPNQPMSGPDRDLWAFRLFAQPSKESLARINKLATELLDELRRPQKKPGQMMSFSLVMAPVAPRRTNRKA